MVGLKKRLLGCLHWVLVILFLICGWKYFFYILPSNDTKSCEVVKMKIKGIVTATGGSGSYQWIEVNNLKESIMPGFSDIKYAKGLSDSYIDYQPGDSIIKKQNSKEMIIKRKDKYAIYIIDCN